LDSLHYSQLDSHILGVSVRQVGSGRSVQSFDLNFYFSHKRISGSPYERSGYEAASELSKTRLEEVCKRFAGPNVAYKRIMI
jgi:hypothetical protein